VYTSVESFSQRAKLAYAPSTVRSRQPGIAGDHGGAQAVGQAGAPTGALTAAVVLETLCRQYLLARSAGTPRLLSTEEMRAAHQRYQTYGQRA